MQASRTNIRFNTKSDYYLDVEELGGALNKALKSRFTMPIEQMEHLITLYRGDFMEQSTLTENELFY